MTLKEVIQDRIAELTAQIVLIRASVEGKILPLQAEIDREQARLTQFGPWLDKDIDQAKSDVADLFAAYQAPAKQASAVQDAATPE